jgi:hypothetical protein
VFPFKLPVLGLDHIGIAGAHDIVMPEIPIQLGAVLPGQKLGIKLFRVPQALVDFDEDPWAFSFDGVPGGVDKVGWDKDDGGLGDDMPFQLRPHVKLNFRAEVIGVVRVGADVDEQFRFAMDMRGVADRHPRLFVRQYPVDEVEVAPPDGLGIHPLDDGPHDKLELLPGAIPEKILIIFVRGHA